MPVMLISNDDAASLITSRACRSTATSGCSCFWSKAFPKNSAALGFLGGVADHDTDDRAGLGGGGRGLALTGLTVGFGSGGFAGLAAGSARRR